MYPNELTMTYRTGEGKNYRVEMGKVSADIGYEDHGMFGLKIAYSWGLSTSTFYGLDHPTNYDETVSGREYVPEPYMHLLITSLLKQFGSYNYISSIKDARAYLLFEDTGEVHEAPAGILNINNDRDALIFKDLLAPFRN